MISKELRGVKKKEKKYPDVLFIRAKRIQVDADYGKKNCDTIILCENG